MQEQKAILSRTPSEALVTAILSKARLPWALAGLALALLVVLVLPSAQIELGAKTLQGLVGSYTTSGSGHYDVTYSGGSYTETTGPPTYTASYDYWLNTNDGTYGGGDHLNFYTSSAEVHTANVSCHGPITATFTWNNDGDPNNLPPASVVVRQYCQTQWMGHTEYGATVSGSCNNPLGGDSVPYSYGVGVTRTRTKYEVKTDPGASFTETCAATASAEGAGGSADGSQGYCAAFVRYLAATDVPIVNPQGVTLDPNDDNAYKLLTGQQVIATLLGIPSGSTNITYQWSVGGDTFKTYNPSKTNNDQLVPLSATDKTQASFDFYDKKAETLTVSCTAMFTAPDGTPLSVTADSRQIQVLKPTVRRWVITEGFVQSRENSSLGTTQYGLFGDPNKPASDPSSNGMYWHDFNIDVPAPFSGGELGFAQLVNPDVEGYAGGVGNPIGIGSLNGRIGLDGSFPYGQNVDSPAHSVATAAPNPNGYNQIMDSNTFTTYMIYRPPSSGTDTIWVPLQKFSWAWSEELTWQNNQWSITAAFPATLGAAPNYTPQDTDDYPQWDCVH